MDTITLVTALLLEITFYTIVIAIIMLQLITVIWILTTIIKKVFKNTNKINHNLCYYTQEEN